MHFLQDLIVANDWFGESFAYNLEFIPADKLDWKPVPTANSALEIVHHIVYGILNMQAVLSGQEYGGIDVAKPISLEEGQSLIRQTARNYTTFLKTVKPEDLEGELTLPFGTFPKSICIAMEVQDMIHHHGQICYIQALLGDDETHIFDADSPALTAG